MKTTEKTTGTTTEQDLDLQMIAGFVNWTKEIFINHIEIVEKMKEAGAFNKK
ncbi:TPA_asm: hypothetical protein [Altiarchaeum virus]|nr:TPA_asm: hypothetical protein [Altiarchaeum virus]